jgi:hypothetical protein
MLMAFNFRVFFSGICAFVPTPDGSFDDPANRSGFFKSVTIVLFNMRRAKAVAGGKARDSHLARLELDRTQNWTGNRDPDLIALRIGKNVFALERERVSFRFTGAAMKPKGIEIVNFDTVPPPNLQEPPKGAPEERFFWWVPKMERVVPGSDKMRGRFLQDLAQEVIGWVELTQGSFAVAPPLSEKVMDFKPINGRTVKLRQKIAPRISVEVSRVDSVEIVFHAVDSSVKKTLSLAGAQGNVDVEIRNRELDHLLGKSILSYGQADIDFTTYFEMTAGRPPAAIIPHRPEEPRAIGIGLHGGVCPPAAFSGATRVAAQQAATPPVSAATTRRATAPKKKAALRKRQPR